MPSSLLPRFRCTLKHITPHIHLQLATNLENTLYMKMVDQPLVAISETEETPSHETGGKKFGTFSGVFLPTLLTILGAVLYLRVGWVVGNAGIGGAIAIILLAHVITITTGLSIASIATNIRVRAGGAFAIISQSLGLEVSTSISIPFYIAQSISVGFYVFAFTEGWSRIFPDHPEELVLFVVFGAMFTIASISAQAASRAQKVILLIQITSLVSVFLGSFALANQQGFTYEPQVIGNFEAGNFWAIFAVFFPAVTGVLAGVNMSGSLKNPRKSIPIGMMSAVLLSMVVYLAVAYWMSRVATPAELQENLTILVDRAFFAPVVLAGLLAATFSAGLTSLVGAPRIIQAVAQTHVIPNGESIGDNNSRGEPAKAMRITAIITLLTLVVGLISGGLNAIAPLMTMFFLVTYAVLNTILLLENALNLVSFRPRLHIPFWVPLIGLIGCVSVMFLINPVFSLVATFVIAALYVYLARNPILNPFGDVRSGLFVAVAEWAAIRVASLDGSRERAWKPNLLVPIASTEELLGSYRFLENVAYPRGSVHILGIHGKGEKHCVSGADELVDAFYNDGIFSRVALLEADSFHNGLKIGLDTMYSAFFRPNTVFMKIEHHVDEEMLQMVLDHVRKNETGAVFFSTHREALLGREQTINVWIREQGPDWHVDLRLSRLNLSILLAYMIAQNWHGRINLIVIVADTSEKDKAQTFLNTLVDVGRLPNSTQTIVATGTFNEYLPHAPRVDLNIFGMPDTISLDFVSSMVERTRATCVFVQDSGQESALA